MVALLGGIQPRLATTEVETLLVLAKPPRGGNAVNHEGVGWLGLDSGVARRTRRSENTLNLVLIMSSPPAQPCQGFLEESGRLPVG